ncbi:DUF2809 domain-containing protein [Lutibacter sp. A80]|nr:DUF2809 domain-containing protein [Lutibacter sp. A80]
MLFYFIKSFLNMKSAFVAITVLIIAYFIEFLQLTQILNYLSIKENSFLRIIFGTTFSIGDLIAYTLGIVTVFLFNQKSNP